MACLQADLRRPVVAQVNAALHVQLGVLEFRSSDEAKISALGCGIKDEVPGTLAVKGKIAKPDRSIDDRLFRGTRTGGSEIHSSFHLHPRLLERWNAGKVEVVAGQVEVKDPA